MGGSFREVAQWTLESSYWLMFLAMLTEGSVDIFMERIIQLLDNKGLRTKKSQEALARVQEFSGHAMALRLLHLYENIIASKASNPP